MNPSSTQGPSQYFCRVKVGVGPVTHPHSHNLHLPHGERGPMRPIHALAASGARDAAALLAGRLGRCRLGSAGLGSGMRWVVSTSPACQ